MVGILVVYNVYILEEYIMPTHGSLTKAGKVRNQTPQIAPIKRKKRSPQQRNRRNYHQMLAEEQFNSGRNQRGRRRRRR